MKIVLKVGKFIFRKASKMYILRRQSVLIFTTIHCTIQIPRNINVHYVNGQIIQWNFEKCLRQDFVTIVACSNFNVTQYTIPSFHSRCQQPEHVNVLIVKHYISNILHYQIDSEMQTTCTMHVCEITQDYRTLVSNNKDINLIIK